MPRRLTTAPDGTASLGRLRDLLVPYIGPLLAVIGSIGWINAQIASLDRGDKDRDKLREVAVGARDKEIANLHEDLRELRVELRHCKD